MGRWEWEERNLSCDSHSLTVSLVFTAHFSPVVMAAASSLTTLSCAGSVEIVPMQRCARILFSVDYDIKQAGTHEQHKGTKAAHVLLIWVAPLTDLTLRQIFHLHSM